MSRHSLTKEPSVACYLEQVVGDDKGSVYEILNGQLSIGRSDDNDVVLRSGSVSRNHVLIEEGSTGHLLIRDNGSKNGVQVNGNTVEQAILRHGDIVQVGDFVFRFNSPTTAPAPTPAPEPALPAIQQESVPSDQILNFGSKRRIKPRRSNRPLLYGLLGVVLVAVLYLQDDKEGTKKPAKTEKPNPLLATEQEVAKPPYLENLDPRKAKTPHYKIGGLEDPTKSKAEVALDKLDWNNATVKEAEQYFRRGRRAYLANNFQRSIQFFQTSLSFDRRHELARFYLKLSVSEAEQEAMKHMQIAVRYFDSLQYDRAIYHFTQVIAQLAHRPKHANIKKAQKYIKISRQRLRAAELFP